MLQVHGTLLNDATLLGTRIGTVLEYFGTKLRDSAFLYLLGFLRQLEHLLYLHCIPYIHVETYIHVGGHTYTIVEAAMMQRERERASRQ